jgi:teichuronic acid biosynthesis glycosyltransferase TuaC
MKVLVIVPHYHTFIKDQVEALSKYVDEINVLVHYNPLSEIARYIPFSYFRHVEKFSKNNLINLNNIPENVKVHLVPVVYFIPDGRNQRLGDKLAKKFENYIKKNKIEFDLIHAHFTWPLGYAGVKLAKEFNVPVIVTIHENREWFMREYNSKNKKIHWTWQNANALIRVNKVDVPLLKRFNKNVFAIPNGFNPNRLFVISQERVREELGLPLDRKIIFSLGNLIERKGFHYLIKAMKIVSKYRPDVMCFIGGNGPLKDKLQAQINELGLQDKVKLLGFVPDENLALWMNAADLFVLPSLSEGNPTVMFEALGVGLPFVGTKVGGVPEIITSDDYGLLCEPGNANDLAEKILIALGKEWDREKIRKYGRQFTWKNIAREILDIYRRVL